MQTSRHDTRRDQLTVFSDLTDLSTPGPVSGDRERGLRMSDNAAPGQYLSTLLSYY